MPNKPSSHLNDPDRNKRYLKDYARYSNLAFKLIAVILAAFFFGRKVDQWLPVGFPLFTLIFSVSGLVVMLLFLVRDLTKK